MRRGRYIKAEYDALYAFEQGLREAGFVIKTGPYKKRPFKVEFRAVTYTIRIDKWEAS